MTSRRRLLHLCSVLQDSEQQTQSVSEINCTRRVRPRGRQPRVVTGGAALQQAATAALAAVPVRSAKELELRKKLAVGYRIANKNGWDQTIFNHITIKVPGTEAEPNGPHFLINPFGLRFDEVTASNLLKVDTEGTIVDPGTGAGPLFKQGFVVHSAVHMARHDLECVVHCHHLDTVSVAMTKEGVLPLSQEAIAVLPTLSYHPFEGTANDLGERERMAASLGPTNRICVLENHGPLTAGSTIEEAFFYMATLTRACEYQARALAQVGGDLSRIKLPTTAQLDDMVQRAKNASDRRQDGQEYNMAKLHFNAQAREIERRDGSENIYC